MIDPTLPRKLGIRAGTRVWLVNAPAGYADALRAAAPNALVEDGGAPAAGTGLVDLVHLFCATRADLDAHGPAAIAAYQTGGHLWVSYPKGGAKAGTDLNRDVDWGPLPVAGFRPVTQVAIDERWSALRFRRIEEVGR
jgi:hypothetical protein